MAFQTSVALNLVPYGDGNSSAALQRSILDLLATYQDAWENSDYQAIRDLASRFYGMSTDIFQRIELITYYSTRNRAFSDGEDASFTQVLKNLAADNSPQAQEIKDAIKTQLDQDLDPADAQTAFDTFLSGEHPIFDKAIRDSKEADEETNFLCEQYAGMVSFGTAADYLGYLRTGMAAPIAPIPPQVSDVNLVKELSTNIKSIVDAAYQDIYNALKNDSSKEELLELIAPYRNELQGIFGIVGALLGAFLPLIPNEVNLTMRVNAYRAALELTENTNRALVQIAYLAYLKANLSDRNFKRWLSNEQRRTDNRTFTSNVDQGEISTIATVTTDPAVAAGTLVQVEGLVTKMEIRDDQNPPKFSTFVILTDVETNESIQLRAHMFGLEDNGVSIGSYVRVNGFVRKGEHWLIGDEVGLDIDRVNLGEIAKDNWLDNVTERMKGYFPLYKDGMNMFFTLN